uniref:(northern house mosquito) hypothetical protein n=1 Tax=Culex pipiens TaxID=7175 RepID=A0A8D8BUZ0_CULPI
MTASHTGSTTNLRHCTTINIPACTSSSSSIGSTSHRRRTLALKTTIRTRSIHRRWTATATITKSGTIHSTPLPPQLVRNPPGHPLATPSLATPPEPPSKVSI